MRGRAAGVTRHALAPKARLAFRAVWLCAPWLCAPWLCAVLAACSAYHGPITNKPDPNEFTPSRYGAAAQPRRVAQCAMRHQDHRSGDDVAAVPPPQAAPGTIPWRGRDQRA